MGAVCAKPRRRQPSVRDVAPLAPTAVADAVREEALEAETTTQDAAPPDVARAWSPPEAWEAPREPEPAAALPGAANVDDEEQRLCEGPASPAHAQQYKVVVRAGAKLQAEFGVKSAVVGTIGVEEVVNALGARTNGYGVLRVFTSQGWLSTTTARGTTILEEVDRFGRPIRAGSSRRFKAATKAITAITALQHASQPGQLAGAKRYRVVAKSTRLQAEFGLHSAAAGGLNQPSATLSF